uniref:KASH domain-containing protein n=1 Tax=Anopheles dirus TaxID=7168 RepID=A0A182MXQ5_9DIPT
MRNRFLGVMTVLLTEFIVGEDADTIWGHSYEVSTDGTPSSGINETTVGGNSSTRVTVDEQNKENLSINQKQPAEQLDANTSWDLSVTLVDDERRRIRSEGSAVFSQSLNTTERLLLEPQAPGKLRLLVNGCSVEDTDVQPMDISPLKPNVMHPSPSKSPRKMIYTFPKQAMFVEINDVVVPPLEATGEPKTPARSSLWRGTNQSTLRGSSSSAYIASETWNSHPNYAGVSIASSPQHTYQANVSSDVDTTIALTAAMTKVLESCSNESIQKATNMMELDESTTALPTNALARARPSFLPTVKPFDDTATPQTPPAGPAPMLEVTNPVDLSSPLEGHVPRASSLSLENLSIMQTPPNGKAGAGSERLTLDLGLSAFSLGGRPSSPFEKQITKPRILRPTMPFALLAGNATEQKQTKQAAPTNDNENVVAMDVSSVIVPQHARTMHTNMTICTAHDDENEKEKEKRRHPRSTDFHSHDIVVDGPVLIGPQRATVLCNEQMEVTAHTNTPRATVYVPETMLTSPQTALDNYRRTIVSNESMMCCTTAPKFGRTVEEVSVHVARRDNTMVDVKFQVESMEQTRVRCNERLTTHAVQAMEEDGDSPVVSKAMNSVRNTPLPRGRSNLNTERMELTAYDDEDPEPEARYGRLTTHATEVMDESVNVQQMLCVTVEDIRHEPRLESRIPRLTTHRQQEMVQEQQHRMESKPRRSIYDRADMDLAVSDSEEMNSGVMLPTAQQVQHKSRKSLYEREDMDLTRTDLEDLKSAAEPKVEQNVRVTIFKREDMDVVKTSLEDPKSGVMPKNELKVRQKSRVLMYEREDMDLTHSGLEELKTGMMLPAEPKLQHKSRMSMYERENMDLTRTDLEDTKSGVVLPAEPKVDQNARVTIFKREDMDVAKQTENEEKTSLEEAKMPKNELKVRQKPRASMYERENMDLTRTDLEELQSGAVLPAEPKVQQKSRITMYEREDMDLTRTDLEEIKNCVALPVEPIGQQNARITIAKLEDMEGVKTSSAEAEVIPKHEPKVGQKPRLTMHERKDMDLTASDLEEVNSRVMFRRGPEPGQKSRTSLCAQEDMDLTRSGSKEGKSAVTMKSESKARQKSRISLYEAEDMDATNVGATSHEPTKPALLKSHAAVNTETDSMRRSVQDVTNYSSFLERYEHSHATTAHDVNTVMYLTAEGQGKAFNSTRLPEEEDCLQREVSTKAIDDNKSRLQAQRRTISHPEEMERTILSPAQAEKHSIVSAFGTFKKSIDTGMEGISLLANDEMVTNASKTRLSINDPAAMAEETVPAHLVGLVKSRSLDYAHIRQRLQQCNNNNDCMDETVLPQSLRVERTSDDAAAESPLVCPAEHPPSITTEHEICCSSAENTMDLTKATVSQPAQGTTHSRLTIHRAASMDLTLIGRGTTPPPPPPDPDRGTIYGAQRPMEETPPVVRTEPISEKRLRWRPRQTILIPQDMDVEGEEETEKEPTVPTLSALPRETTEDCMLRSASILPRHNFLYREDPSLGGRPDEFVRQRTLPGQKTAPEVRPFSASELTDISMSFSTARPELPNIGNITSMMASMREITEPLPPAVVSFQEHSNSVSVICRTGEPPKQEDLAVQTLAFVPSGGQTDDASSDDEYCDAEGEQEVDPLSLTKSRHLTMKFVDVEQLERTSKRLHSEVLASPVVSAGRPTMADELDPLQMTHAHQTPNGGPNRKRPRTIPTSPVAMTISVEDEDIPGTCEPEESAANERADSADVIVEEERQTLADIPSGRVSQTLIHDPSVFVLEDGEDLLDDESDLPCVSLTEETRPANRGDPEPAAAPTEAPAAALAELSYYRDFANMTIESLDSWQERKVSARHDAPTPEANDPVECISVSDGDSLTTFTPPKRSLASTRSAIMGAILNPKAAAADDVLDSTVADEIMYELRRTRPIVRHPCCGVRTEECLCQLRRELQCRKERCDLVTDRWCSGIEKIRQRLGIAPGKPSSGVTLDEKFQELNWRLLYGKLEEESFLFEQDCAEVSRRRSAGGVACGRYPETPSVVFLAENYRSYLLEQLYVDNSPPPGASLPAAPRITLLIANKLATDSGKRWQLDCADECDGLLLLRHRTLRSFVLSVQIQPPRGGKTVDRETPSEHWRLERIQVREYPQGRVDSPKLLLAHNEFMRLAKETTVQTLRSTYRTVASLMGLWQRFDELLRRVFDAVNHLLTIVRNNDGMLCYDAQMERFCVQKYFHRTLADGCIEPNRLLVHFNSVASIGAPGVNFQKPVPEGQKLLPMAATGVGAGGTDDKATGLMFLECLLWNVTKQYGA